MNWRNLLDRLEFNNDTIFNNNVCLKSFIKNKAVIAYWNCLLPFNRQSPFTQFVSQYDFINRFKQTWTKLRLYMKCGIDNLFGDLIFFHR